MNTGKLYAAVFGRLALVLPLMTFGAEARVTHLTIEHRSPVLNGKSFGLAGPYEKLSGKVHFALDPAAAANSAIVDLGLATRNASGEVEFSADFFLIKPIEPARGNGRLLYEVGNRGGKALLQVFQKAAASSDPTTAAEFGDGALMYQGYSLLWMGWQWDTPAGKMSMDLPIATDHGAPITGLVRGNFIPNTKTTIEPLTDRGHKAYPIVNPSDPESFMIVRDRPLGTPQRIPREKWRFVDDATVSLEGSFALGRIYDVVIAPAIQGCSAADWPAHAI